MQHANAQFSVLFVCLGNICRSPIAQGVFGAVASTRGQGGRTMVGSAGTGGWHVGSPPDPRAEAVAARHGIDIGRQRCRRIEADDFSHFDLILGMDRANVRELLTIAPPRATGKIHLFLDYAQGEAVDVPDPYYGGPDGFETVYRMIRKGSEALASRLWP